MITYNYGMHLKIKKDKITTNVFVKGVWSQVWSVFFSNVFVIYNVYIVSNF